LADWISEDDLVRVIDLLVGECDFPGFHGSKHQKQGVADADRAVASYSGMWIETRT